MTDPTVPTWPFPTGKAPEAQTNEARDWPGDPNPGGMECMACGAIFIGNEWRAFCRPCDEIAERANAEHLAITPQAAESSEQRQAASDASGPDDTKPAGTAPPEA
jgi:hypothetical protein